jgi:hypothetical protein
MKQCPRCNKTYTDEALNFCLEDGELLTILPYEQSASRFADDPPTMIIDQARVTNPVNWPQSSQPQAQPPAQWQASSPVHFQSQGKAMVVISQSKGLAITSLCLGIASVTIGLCCYLGVLLSPAAIITGLIYLSQNKNDSVLYPARGIAIGGIVTGIVYFLILALIIIIYGAAVLVGGVN